MYLREMAPTVLSVNGNKVPVYDEYSRIVQWLMQLDKDDPYRVKLLGANVIIDAPLEYYVEGVRQKIGVQAWEALTLSEQGKRIARIKLEPMVRLIEEHVREQFHLRNRPQQHSTPAASNRRKRR